MSFLMREFVYSESLWALEADLLRKIKTCEMLSGVT